jgi:hypothetical protein
MAKVILVRGPINIGKTTTIGLIYSRLALLSEDNHIFDNEEVNVNSLKFDNNGNTKDFTAILKLKNKNCKIGIISEGDVPEYVEEKLKFFQLEQLDYLIGATRSLNRRGSTYRLYLEKYSPLHPIVLEVFPTKSVNRNDLLPTKEVTVNQVVDFILNQ